MEDNGSEAAVRQRHVIIAMNRLTGMSLARHKGLPLNRTTIITSKEEVAGLDGIDIHDMSIHVAGDKHNIPADAEVFHAVLSLCTNH